MSGLACPNSESCYHYCLPSLPALCPQVKEQHQLSLSLHQQRTTTIQELQQCSQEFKDQLDHLATSEEELRAQNENLKQQVLQQSQVIKELQVEALKDTEAIHHLEKELSKAQVRERPWVAGQEGLELASSLGPS